MKSGAEEQCSLGLVLDIIQESGNSFSSSRSPTNMASGAVFCTATILALAHLLTSAPISRCAPAEGVSLHLHLRSHLNTTGHRVVSASVESAGPREQQVDVDVTQREVDLQGRGQLLALDAVAAVLAEVRASEEAAEQLGAPRPPLGAAPDGEFEEVHYADYRALNGSGLYKVHRRALSWAEARAACEGEHAHLLVPETEAEARAAAGVFARGPQTAGARRQDLFFVGLSDAAREGHYVTVTGKNLTSLAFQSWHALEPSKGPRQNGVALDVNSSLHDIPNDWKLGFVCEAPASAR